MAKEISKKANDLMDIVKLELKRYEAENVPVKERRLFVRAQDVKKEIMASVNAIRKSEATNRETIMENSKRFIGINQQQRKVSICRVIKEMVRYNADDVVEKVFGANKKAIMNLLKTDWVSKTYKALGIGTLDKTYLAFNLYRWQSENNAKKVSVTGVPTEKEIEAMIEKGDKSKIATVKDWKEAHACVVYVEVHSDTMAYTKYNKCTLAGLYYSEKLVSEKAVLLALQKEFAYKAMIEKKKVHQQSIDTLASAAA